MSPTSIRRFLRTARRLRWSQILWRAYRGLQRKLGRKRIPLLPRAWCTAGRPPVRQDFPDVPLFHQPGPAGERVVDLAERGEFEHLNLKRKLGRDEPEWHLGPVTRDRLWTVTLHYHAWAFALAEAAGRNAPYSMRAAELFRHYLSGWMDRCDLAVPGARDLAWNSFAVATRIAWWVRSYLALTAGRFERWGDFEKRFLTSLWRQAAYLQTHIEWDLRGNHLMRDAAGLAWAGRFFDGPHAQAWMKTAARIACSQVDEQVLPDGGHFERSPMYHVQVMEDCLSLAVLLEDEAAASRMRSCWSRMAGCLRWMRHPDGGIPLLNDAALNGACDPSTMLSLGGVLGVKLDVSLPSGGRHLPDTGMVAWHGDPWTLLFDIGPLGPDYQPGHGHADTLSVECSFRGRRLFVDPGTYGYDHDERRRYDRSTRAHNTVCVDGRDSSEVWHIFRVGRRARPREVQVDLAGGELVARASHGGHRHLPGRPQHRRSVRVSRNGTLEIADTVSGRSRQRLEGGLLVGPGWAVRDVPGGWLLSQGSDRLRVTAKGPDGLELHRETRPYHPEFGRELDRPRLSWHIEAPAAEVVTHIASD